MNFKELFKSSEVLSMYDLYTVELLKFVILAKHSKCLTEELKFFRIGSSASLMTRSIKTGFYELLPASSVKLKSSFKNRDDGLLNHVLGRKTSFVGLKTNSKVSKNLSKNIPKLGCCPQAE